MSDSDNEAPDAVSFASAAEQARGAQQAEKNASVGKKSKKRRRPTEAAATPDHGLAELPLALLRQAESESKQAKEAADQLEQQRAAAEEARKERAALNEQRREHQKAKLARLLERDATLKAANEVDGLSVVVARTNSQADLLYSLAATPVAPEILDFQKNHLFGSRVQREAVTQKLRSNYKPRPPSHKSKKLIGNR